MGTFSSTEKIFLIGEAEYIIEKAGSNVDIVNLLKQGKSEEVLSCLKRHRSKKFRNQLLRLAAKYNNFEIVVFLLESGCNVTIKDESSGMTPFMIAVAYRNFHLAEILHDAEIDLLCKQVLPKYWRCSSGYKRKMVENPFHNELVTKMRKRGLSSEQIGEALAKATDCRPPDVVRFHDPVMTKAYFQSTDWMGIDMACKVFDIVTSKLDFEHLLVILQNPPRLEGNVFVWFCRYIMCYVHKFHKTKSGKKFLKRIFSFEVFSEATLQAFEESLFYIRSWEKRNIKIFLKYDFHSLVKAKYGRDIIASVFGNPVVKITSVLKDKHIDVDGRGYNGKTPLHFAAENIAVDNVIMLLKRGADPNVFDENGRTPLGLAIFKDNSEMCVNLLLLGGANPLLISNRFEEVVMTYRCDFFERFINVNRLVIAQLVIYETLGQSIESFNRLFAIIRSQKLEKFIEDCRQQLKEFKARRVRDTQVTMFTVVSKAPEIVACHVSRDDVQTIFKFVEGYDKTLIPYYRDLLKKNAENINAFL